MTIERQQVLSLADAMCELDSGQGNRRRAKGFET
jgi:hypothetical protein